MYILVINAGSSSVKYKLFDMENGSVLAEGMVDRIALEDSFLKHQAFDGRKTDIESEINNYEKALKLITEILVDSEYGVIDNLEAIGAIGHRVVHGGEKASESVLITPEVEDIIKRCFDLAPLHNPPNMMGIEACKKILPKTPQIAVFDTVFHRTIPEKAYLYAIPYKLYEQYSIRRYGFHGTSHRYVANRACELLNKPKDNIKMVTCHLGSGCSITAVKDGKSVDTSMGFTPLEGLIMGTRSGDIDPAIIFYLIERIGLTVSEVNTMLNKQSGLLGLSGLSRDMRDLEEEASGGNKQAQISIKSFAYRVKKYIGSYAAAMSGLDALIFTAGIGENSSKTRTMICDGLDFLNIKLDSHRNTRLEGEGFISRDDSKVKVLVIPTDEELMIARDTMEIAFSL